MIRSQLEEIAYAVRNADPRELEALRRRGPENLHQAIALDVADMMAGGCHPGRSYAQHGSGGRGGEHGGWQGDQRGTENNRMGGGYYEMRNNDYRQQGGQYGWGDGEYQEDGGRYGNRGDQYGGGFGGGRY